jgi:nicotinamidase-related amidase
MAQPLDVKKTALLLLDLQVGVMMQFPDHPILDKAAAAIVTARKYGVQIAHIRVALDAAEAQPVPTKNTTFSALRADPKRLAMMSPDAPTTQFHDKVKPQEGDLVQRKVRYSPFMVNPSKALLEDFEKRGIDTTILAGVATSGAVLSAVRQLADLDFGLLVVEDCCADADEEVHRILVQKVFPKQAKVIKSEELEGLF